MPTFQGWGVRFGFPYPYQMDLIAKLPNFNFSQNEKGLPVKLIGFLLE
jgi:hypothetical protein